MRIRLIATVAVSLVLAVGCSSTTSAPKTDDEKIQALYSEFRIVMRQHDADRLRALFCPGVRTKIEPKEWFKDVGQLSDISTIENFAPPDGGANAPDATEWRRLIFEQGGHMRIAKIGDDWFVCET